MTDEILDWRLDGTTLIVKTPDAETRYDSRFLVAALLVYVARGSGRIAPEESGRMIELIEDYFHMADKPALGELLTELGPTLSQGDKEDIALMGLKVVAAADTRQVAEMEQFNRAMEAVGISPEIVHRAFDRYFAETMPGGE